MKINLSILLITLLFSNCIIQNSYAEEIMSFVISFVYKHNSEEICPIDFSKTEHKLQSGTEYKIFFKPIIKNTYIYIIKSVGFDKKYLFLYPYPDYYDYCNILNNDYYLPDQKDWYIFNDNKILEEFTLIVSNKKLRELENKIETYLIHENIDSGENKKAKKELEAELRDLRLKNSKFVRKPEEAVIISGGNKGSNDEIKKLAKVIKIDISNKVEDLYVYSKTIKLFKK